MMTGVIRVKNDSRTEVTSCRNVARGCLGYFLALLSA
jgi:hypothetical protein